MANEKAGSEDKDFGIILYTAVSGQQALFSPFKGIRFHFIKSNVPYAPHHRAV